MPDTRNLALELAYMTFQVDGDKGIVDLDRMARKIHELPEEAAKTALYQMAIVMTAGCLAMYDGDVAKTKAHLLKAIRPVPLPAP